jgi:hypothetical protein
MKGVSMKNPNGHERRRFRRQMLAYYLPVLDNKTQEILGHLVDISPAGFMIDAKLPVQNRMEYDLRFDFMEDIAGRASLEFKARNKWCSQNSITPFVYNAGFEITDIPLDSIDVVKRIGEKYASG